MTTQVHVLSDSILSYSGATVELIAIWGHFSGRSTSVVESSETGRPHQPERKHRRFPGTYPVHLTFQSGAPLTEIEAVSKNVSIGGMLLKTASPIPQRSSVNFTIRLHGIQTIRPIDLVGEGEVVRVEPQGIEGFAIAIKCSRPISQIETYLSTAPS